MISPRIELGTFCVLSRCHNQLDHETISENYSFGRIYEMNYISMNRGDPLSPEIGGCKLGTNSR